MIGVRPCTLALALLAASFASKLFCAEPKTASESKASDRTAADKAALAPLQSYVAGWKGVGQPQRGSTKGAWSEQADWAWHFANSRASLVFKATDGKYFVAGELLPGEQNGSLELIATPADRKTQDHYRGETNSDGQLILTVDPHAPADAARPDRISFRQVAGGDRLIVLYERRLAGTDRYTRMAEVGYTRKGAAFATGNTGPECVVTGGAGTIEVEYQGKKYYVCCTGCRDLFLEDPEGVLAEYRERKAKKSEKQ